MKIVWLFFLAFLISLSGFAQVVTPVDTIKPGKDPDKQVKEIKEEKVKQLSDSVGGNEPKKSPLIDTTVQNKYGDLLDDDTTYNKRYSWWKPAVEVIGINAAVFAIDRYIFKYDWSTSVSSETWKRNLQTGWEFDNDRFGINFSGHPYTGALYFNAARSHGYGYFESLPFALEGSVMWEYFGENTLPSYNDVINTTVNGAFLGELMYRVSSNILDDRTTGFQRTWREIAAGIVDPVRGINRLLQGKTFTRTNKEIYQKEPLNVTLFGGVHFINKHNALFGSGTTNPIVNLQLDYGNPFELRKRKAFDFFRLRTEFSFNAGRKLLDNVLGYGILFGKNAQVGKFAMLIGGFQYYDYWDNPTFELMSIGLGGGIFTKAPLSKTSNLYTNLHLGWVPLGASSGRSGPDTSQFRDYAYAHGFEGKIESTFILDKYLTASVQYYYYFLRNISDVKTIDYVSPFDVPGNNNLVVIKPNVTVHVYKGLSIGYEHYIFMGNRYSPESAAVHTTNTEEKIFILFYFEDPQRKGHYN